MIEPGWVTVELDASEVEHVVSDRETVTRDFSDDGYRLFIGAKGLDGRDLDETYQATPEAPVELKIHPYLAKSVVNKDHVEYYSYLDEGVSFTVAGERTEEPQAMTDGGTDLATHEFHVQDDGSSIVYGPWDENPDEWMLGLSTENGERVRLLLGKSAMYELWTEVHNTPWPRETELEGTLSREIVEKVNGMDEDQLREVLETVDAVGGDAR